MKVGIEFISSDAIKTKTREEKIRYILNQIRRDQILVIEEALSADEEMELIKSTMERISDKFPGIEVATLGREAISSGLKKKIIQMLGGKTGGLTVIGPSKMVSDIKRDPEKISLLARSGKK